MIRNPRSSSHLLCPPLHPLSAPRTVLLLLDCWSLCPLGGFLALRLTQLSSGPPRGSCWRLVVGQLTWVSDLMAQLLQLVQLWDRRNEKETKENEIPGAVGSMGAILGPMLGESPKTLPPQLGVTWLPSG